MAHETVDETRSHEILRYHQRPCGRPFLAAFRKGGHDDAVAYNKTMPHPITVDNSRPATVHDTARILGVSKKRTNQLIELVRRMIHKDDRTGEFVIRTKNNSRNGSTKASKTNSKRRKTSR